ncbi:glycosyltransferase involved in cell wall biosynthesis [Mucilaginibacter sp. UYNi724]
MLNNNKAKICIVSQSHLCRNPRVLKEALALSAALYRVTILTAIYSDPLYREDLSLLSGTGISYEIYSDLRKPAIAGFISRLTKKFWLFAQSAGIESRLSLGYGALRLKKRICMQKADLYIMHQELATVTGSLMVHTSKVAFDIEDWYSQDLLPSARKKRPIKLLKRAEKIAIEDGVACYTTSHALALGLQAFYKTTNMPSVIYNSFSPNTSVCVPKKQDVLHLYWLSQTIGEGRGLEFFIHCMAQSTTKFKLSLRGNVSESYKNSLSRRLSPKDQIVFLPLLKNQEILADTGRYHIGLALEPDNPPNKDLTVSNKLFHYMAAGLPVIASYTQGHAEIATQCPDFIFLYKQNQAVELTGILNQVGSKLQTNELSSLKSKILHFYTSKFSWPGEAIKLVNLINRIFEKES